MQSNRSISFLRRVLAFDAVSCGGMALAMLAFGSMLAPLTNLPLGLLREAAWVLAPFAAFLGFLASRAQPWRPGVWIVIALNVVWVIDSIALLFTGWIEPNALGVAFVVAQAAVVGVLAVLEYVGVRRSALTVAA